MVILIIVQDPRIVELASLFKRRRIRKSSMKNNSFLSHHFRRIAIGEEFLRLNLEDDDVIEQFLAKINQSEFITENAMQIEE